MPKIEMRQACELQEPDAQDQHRNHRDDGLDLRRARDGSVAEQQRKG